MNKSVKITFLSFFLLNFISSCTGREETTPYGEILNNKLFAGLTDSIRQAPRNDALYFRRAILLNQNNFPEPALADFKKAWSIKKEEKYAYGISILLVESEPDSAIIFLKNALRELPASILLQLSLARAYDNKNETDEALTVCNQLLEQHPEQVDALKLSADLFSKKGNSTEAIKRLEQAYQLTPFDMELNYMLALKYAENKNNRVISLCDSLIKKDSMGLLAEPFYYKGIYFANINEKAKAMLFFDEAVKHNYTFLEGYIEKGALLFDMKKYSDAIKVFNLALTITPEFPDSYYWIAKCQQALGQKDEAKLNYKRAVGLDQKFTAAIDSLNTLK